MGGVRSSYSCATSGYNEGGDQMTTQQIKTFKEGCVLSHGKSWIATQTASQTAIKVFDQIVGAR